MNCKNRFLAGALALMTALSVMAGCSEKKEEYDRYNYDLSEYVKLDTYKGIEIEDAEFSITQSDVESQVLLARSNYATAVEKTGAAAMTDQLNVDFTGYLDGETFAGGSDTDVDLTLGSGMLIDGFEEGLVGAKPGETVTLDLAFPDPYQVNPDLSGKPVQFVVTVNHIYEQQLPEYTDEFVKTYYGYETIAAFEEALRESLEQQYESNRTYYKVHQVWSEILDKAEILNYPQAEYNEMYQSYISYYTSLAQEAGTTLNEYAASEMGMAVSEFNDWVASEVQAYLKEEMILYYIARQENIDISEEEYQSGALSYAQYYNLSSVEELEAHVDPEDIRQNILFDKVLEYLADQAKLKS